MKKSRSIKILPMLCLGLLLTGCLGANSASNGLRNWNAKVTGNEWANEGIFLVMIIVPVYQIAWVADVVFFNSWDFWTGKPLLEDPGAYPKDAPSFAK